MKKIAAIITLLLSCYFIAEATTVQQRLDQGEAPKQIFDSGIALDSLYGKTYQGGLIFYLDTIYGNGLLSSISNQSNGAQWGCYGNYLGAMVDSIGSGINNTSVIIAGCGTSGIAAKLCDNYVYNGYNDWFLPSKDELFLMYKNLYLNSFGNFNNATYWSSSEASSMQAWYLSFYNGNFNTATKSGSSYVRAARSFEGPQILLLNPQICIVGVDSNNYNRVIWERDGDPLIDTVNIYKETSSSGQYIKIGSKPYNSQGIFTDSFSNPSIMAYRYKIALLDSNGMESFLSLPHKTMHLTINAGLGGVWNLIWSGYEGFNFTSYNIYRGSDSLNMQLLLQIQSNLTSYTDLNPPAGNVYYQIEVVSPHPCYPDSVYSKANTNYNYSRSNTANSNLAPNIGFANILQGNLSLALYPNPNKGQFTLELNSTTSKIQTYQLEVYSVMGKLIHSEALSFGSKLSKAMHFEHLSKGVYFVRLRSKDNVLMSRFIVD